MTSTTGMRARTMTHPPHTAPRKEPHHAPAATPTRARAGRSIWDSIFPATPTAGTSGMPGAGAEGAGAEASDATPSTSPEDAASDGSAMPPDPSTSPSPRLNGEHGEAAAQPAQPTQSPNGLNGSSRRDSSSGSSEETKRHSKSKPFASGFPRLRTISNDSKGSSGSGGSGSILELLTGRRSSANQQARELPATPVQNQNQNAEHPPDLARHSASASGAGSSGSMTQSQSADNITSLFYSRRQGSVPETLLRTFESIRSRPRTRTWSPETFSSLQERKRSPVEAAAMKLSTLHGGLWDADEDGDDGEDDDEDDDEDGKGDGVDEDAAQNLTPLRLQLTEGEDSELPETSEPQNFDEKSKSMWQLLQKIEMKYARKRKNPYGDPQLLETVIFTELPRDARKKLLNSIRFAKRMTELRNAMTRNAELLLGLPLPKGADVQNVQLEQALKDLARERVVVNGVEVLAQKHVSASADPLEAYSALWVSVEQEVAAMDFASGRPDRIYSLSHRVCRAMSRTTSGGDAYFVSQALFCTDDKIITPSHVQSLPISVEIRRNGYVEVHVPNQFDVYALEELTLLPGSAQEELDDPAAVAETRRSILQRLSISGGFTSGDLGGSGAGAGGGGGMGSDSGGGLRPILTIDASVVERMDLSVYPVAHCRTINFAPSAVGGE
mmetsp:Transcript_15527/g.47340  ORF Transcript_15527/g.47340 Transcript_15527/m.47340 type:complete len:669 (-) Transcript_15527:327-2333(-)